jgi:energy-coupling factor transport system ATP-binding protein
LHHRCKKPYEHYLKNTWLLKLSHNLAQSKGSSKMLELKRLHYQPATAEEPVLRGLDLKAGLGQPILIAGASGSGKTTLVEIISGLSKPQKGLIYWNKNPLKAAQRRWLCGVVFQFPERYFLGLTVAQELRLGHRRLSGEDQANALKKVGLSKIDLRQAPERLSGGQQRRLAIAVQLLRSPSILLLDEPTAGLDWSVRNEVIELLATLAKEQLLIVATHEPELFKDILSSTYFLKKGKLLPITTLS